jgi:hypothetical protein
VAGICTTVCPTGQVACSGTCVNTTTDANNCGACGHVCSTGTHCVGGTCVCDSTSCPNGCCLSGQCVTSTNDHCGNGGNTCVSCGTGGQTCVSGVCTCPTGTTTCGTTCCATPGCCGSACQITHSNGLGQNYFDCNPVQTFTANTATEACMAYTAVVGGTCQTFTCGAVTNPVVCAADASSTPTACWGFTGANAGHVVSGGLCPTTTDPTWN